MPESFAPISFSDSRVLILGTMPSVASLRYEQYYGHPQNAFWTIIFSLWEEKVPADYDKRTAFLKEKQIALWDVINICERQGSADADIIDPKANDFEFLARKCPMLEAVFFNSKNAAVFYKRLVVPDAFESLPKLTLPSTSPARAMKFEKKREMWLPVRFALEYKNIQSNL